MIFTIQHLNASIRCSSIFNLDLTFGWASFNIGEIFLRRDIAQTNSELQQMRHTRNALF